VKIGGITGFVSTSRIVYAEAPDRPHELIAAYVFPDRARWWIALEGEPDQRVLSYRRGVECFAMDSGSASSHRLEGAAREDWLRRCELRRALMLWPEGFAWRGAETDRLAEMGALGALRAELDERGTLVSMSSLDARGKTLERYDRLVWREEQGRRWPASLAFSFEGEAVWTETVLSVQTPVRFLDSFFVPPDRRPDSAAAGTAQGEMLEVDLPPVTLRRVPLARGLDWEGTLADVKRLFGRTRAELAPLGLALDERFTIELTPGGQPSAVLLRLKARAATPPSGWEAVGERTAFSVLLPGPPPIDPSVLRAMLARVPAGAEAEAFYVRFSPPESKTRRLQVVLPLLPPE